MSPSPTANRSFLHGSRKASLQVSDKVVYATLDSLALKRARLPLQLMPVDGDDVADHRTEKSDGEKKLADKTSSTVKHSPYEVRCAINMDIVQQPD